MNATVLRQLAAAWRRHFWLRALLGSALAAEAAYMLAGAAALAPVFLATAAVLLLGARPWRIREASLAAHLDRTHPQLEESSALWLRDPAELGPLERLQRRRIESAFPPAERARLQPPTRGLVPLGLLALALPLLLASLHFVPPLQRGSLGREGASKAARSPSPPAAAAPIQVLQAELHLIPPAYTGRAPRTVAGLEAEVEAGSTVQWRLAFSAPPAMPQIQFTHGPALPLVSEGSAFRAETTVSELTIYTLAGVSGTHILRVIPDRPPVLAIAEPTAVRTELAAPAPVRVVVRGSDDYGIAAIWLVATVAKGTGEAVKFREQKFALTGRPGDAPGREFEATLDLPALGLAAGDELYFHVEALDGRTPSPNLARSETHFLTVRGPQQVNAGPGRGLTGINPIPEYFRSQRQLIIDTEKLMAERPTLPEKTFRERANELGIDQHLLRLRYGRFLGEETEGDLAPASPSARTNAAGIPESMIHRHDDGHDHGGPRATGEDKKSTETSPKDAKDVIAPFVHQHDSTEVATFFDGQTKGTLRDVLSAMWESERFLRQAQLPESLPAQHRALAILKYLQQGDRAYVQRVGFEAAPLKIEERRMQGDISSVPRFGRATQPAALPEESIHAAREALQVVDFAARRGALGEAERRALSALEGAFAGAAGKASGTRLEAAVSGLQAVREALAGKLASLPAAQQAAWQLLPAAQARPDRPNEGSGALTEKYREMLSGGSPRP